MLSIFSLQLSLTGIAVTGAVFAESNVASNYQN